MSRLLMCGLMVAGCTSRDAPPSTIPPPVEVIVRPTLLCETPYGEWERTEQVLVDDVAGYALAGQGAIVTGERRLEVGPRPMQVLWMTQVEGRVETEAVIVEDSDTLWPTAATADLGTVYVFVEHDFTDPEVIETEILRIERDGTISARVAGPLSGIGTTASLAVDEGRVVLAIPDGRRNTDVTVFDRDLTMLAEQHFGGHGFGVVRSGRDGIRLAAAEINLGVVHVYRLEAERFVLEITHETGRAGWVYWVDDHVSVWAEDRTLLLRDNGEHLEIAPPPGALGVVEMSGSRTPFGLVLAATSEGRTWLGVLNADDSVTDWDSVFLFAVLPSTHAEFDTVAALGIDLRGRGRPLTRVAFRCPIPAPI